MPFRAKKLDSVEALYEYALKALMRRSHSVFEMRKALERHAEDKNLVRSVLDRLKQHKYLDDARYAVQFARQRSENRRQGRHRIARELRARGVPDRHIETALEEVLRDVDAAAQVRQRIERKLRSLRGTLDERKIASLYATLLRAGFDADIIRRELRAVTKRGAEELPEIVDAETTDEHK
jgi:regulatory protein